MLAAIAAVTLVSLIAWVGLRDSETTQAQLQPPVVSPPTPVVAPIIAESAESNSALSPQPALPPPAVLREVTPNVPRAISKKIKGRIYVTVRVLVEPSGDVTGVLLENPGPSKYFARLADNAAREWQFAQTDNQRPRVWLLRFQFTRDGVAVRATEQ